MSADSTTPQRRRIAILGGGMGSLSTAFMLTEGDDWQDRYEVTIYQLGWRLGGKGASGRNMAPTRGSRIEEHGIHIFWGFYNNAFRLVQECYEELGRSPEAPLSNWREALEPHSFGVVAERIGDEWRHWPVEMPANDAEPGTDAIFLELSDYLSELMNGIFDRFRQSPYAASPLGLAEPPRWIKDLIASLAGTADSSLNVQGQLLQAGCELARRLRGKTAGGFAIPLIRFPASASKDKFLEIEWIDVTSGASALSKRLLEGGIEVLVRLLRWTLGSLWPRIEGRLDDDFEAHQLWTGLNLAYGALHGALRDDLFDRGLDAINHRDFSDWLGDHVIPDGERTVSSALVRWFYDSAFAFVEGDVRRPDVEAGTALRAYIRFALTYKGAFYYKFTTSLGDAVFAPLYLVLERRGVKFEFFHRVDRLRLTTDQRKIAAIDLTKQVAIKPDVVASGGYDPLVDVRGLPCWPAAPRYEQIVDGARLEALGVNLEAIGEGAIDERAIEGEPLCLEVDRDFDDIVLGISIEALPQICDELINANRRWLEMTRNVRTVATQAFQIWLRPSLQELGWNVPTAMLTAYDPWLQPGGGEGGEGGDMPVNSWADMSQTLPYEDWPRREPRPMSVSYFCGPLPDSESKGDATAERERVKQTAIRFMEEHIAAVLPLATSPAAELGAPFRWDLLHVPSQESASDIHSFDSQFWYAPANLSDRYVLSVAGSSRFRLRADESMFDNLYLTGDWINNTFNLGCIESAVMSGMAASNAMIGSPLLEEISGWGLGAAREKTWQDPDLSNVVDYYKQTEFDYRSIIGLSRHHGIHYGYYDLPATTNPLGTHSTAEAILKMNWVLAQRAGIQPGMRVLDAGCGIGGSSIWLARHTKAHVTGVTLVERQRALAENLARQAGLSEQTAFFVEDYRATRFPDDHFDIVWAIESVCYSPDKRDFLQEARRVLRPEGVLIVADGYRSRRNLTMEESGIMKGFLDGWAVPDLDTVQEFEASVNAVGFGEVESLDVTPNVMPFARWLGRRAILAAPVAGLLHQVRLVSGHQIANAVAAIEQYRGLEKGLWRYMIFRAQNS